MRALTTEGRPSRPRYARSTNWREARFVALDFETTGLDPASDHVIAYGVVPVEGGRALAGSARRQLVHPPTGPPGRTQKVHLLRPVDLAAAPTIGEVAGDLRAAITGRILLAWFADVEIAFLRRIYGGSERAWRRRTVDVRDLAIAVDGGPASARTARGYGLTATAERYGVPVANAHDALDDALVTAQLFLVLASKLPDRPRPSVGDLLQLSR